VFRYGRGSGAADEILAAVRSAGLLVRDLTTSQADLEQVFLDLLRRS
jgi:ABC-2 type transport system ATP-binding protein